MELGGLRPGLRLCDKVQGQRHKQMRKGKGEWYNCGSTGHVSRERPQPYKGKGVRYIDEIVRRKAGKSNAATGKK